MQTKLRQRCEWFPTEVTRLNMAAPRVLKREERELIAALIAGAPNEARLLGALVDAQVKELNDGGMGSLRFIADGVMPRRFGARLVERQLIDSDGVPVSVAVYLDEYGDLYELDVWKVDFSPVRRFPDVGG